MFTVKITNFKAITKGELEVQGFTALIGPSDVGKSWILKSILYALYNRPGGHFTVDTNLMDIELYFPKDDEFPALHYVWRKLQKGTAINSVVFLNGEEIKKLGRSPLNLDIYGIKVLDIPKYKKLYPNFWSQFGIPFLVFEPPSRVFDALNKLFENEAVAVAHKDLASDSKKAKGLMDSTAVSIQQTQIRCNSFNEFLTTNSQKAGIVISHIDTYRDVISYIKHTAELVKFHTANQIYLSIMDIVKIIDRKTIQTEAMINNLDMLNVISKAALVISVTSLAVQKAKSNQQWLDGCEYALSSL